MAKGERLFEAALENSVYVLPRSEQAVEDFQWVLREIVEGGGDASVCETRFVEGLSDDQVGALFHAARDADYAQLAEEIRGLFDELPRGTQLLGQRRSQVEVDLARIERRIADVAAIDFFAAPGRSVVDGLLAGLEQRLHATRRDPQSTAKVSRDTVRAGTWVTRKRIHVDRMASAWLIRRWIDPDAQFKFVPAKGYRAARGELCFDMFEADFTHEGDPCTFEVLIERFGVSDPGLRPIAEIVHDIDLKDSKFARPETAGIDRLVAGIAMAHKDDDARLARGSAVFGDLYEYFRRRHK